jgi:hypothetical protein
VFAFRSALGQPCDRPCITAPVMFLSPSATGVGEVRRTWNGLSSRYANHSSKPSTCSG